MNEARRIEDDVLAPVFAKKPLTIVRGQNATLWSDDGTPYVDLGANFGVANVGHSHPRVVEAIRAQAIQLTHLQQTLYSPPRAAFLARLRSILPSGLSRVFLSNSGAEAVESALKYARVGTRRSRFVAARNAFHGRTLGALGATWKPEYRRPFEPLTPTFDFVPYNDPAALDRVVTEETAALILEPVQGEGGVIPATAEYLREARRVCRERGALLIFDEIQTGLGRTGRTWAFERYGVEPDLLCMGKSIAGGLPMGVLAMREDVAQAMPRGAHGTTFGGSPLVCAAAEATLGVLLEERLAERSERLGELALERLRTLQVPVVRETRGIGLMIGVDLRVKPQPVLERLLERRVLALQAGTTVLRLLPPLTIPHAQLNEGLDRVVETLGERAWIARPEVAAA